MFRRLKLLFFLLILSSVGYGNIAPIRSLADIDYMVNRACERYDVPGIAVGVIVDHQVILARGYGWRNLTTPLPVTEQTLFAIGSCTKAFTSFILGQLVDEGKIGWDDPVNKYIPEFRLSSRNTKEITIRDLLAHRTGLSRHDEIWYSSKIRRSDLLRHLQYLKPECGLRKKFYYNNLLYSVAGILIERVTDQTWEEAVFSRILSPLGMSKTNLSIEHLQKSHDFSLPYASMDGQIVPLRFHHLSAIEPAGSINANVEDMLKWVELQLSEGKIANKSFVQKETLDEMHSLQMPFYSSGYRERGTSQYGYGLGWYIESYRGQTMIRHGGGIDGFTAEVALLPQQKIGIVILTNSSTDGISAIAYLRNIILDRLI